MLNKKSENFFKLIIIFFFLLQIILISHRLSFDFKNILLINVREAGLKESLRNEKVFEIYNLNKKYKNNNFNLSIKLMDEKIYQRAVESNYPVLLTNQSQNIFFLINEKKKTNCKLIEELKYLALYSCK
jgi:3'-phosphoadenosine 5'-phosphosulfate sulfotransferase